MGQQIDPEERRDLKALVKNVYRIQRMRIQAGNRLVAKYKEALGTNAKGSEILEILALSYRRIADGVSEQGVRRLEGIDEDAAKRFVGNFTNKLLWDQYKLLLGVEKSLFNEISRIIEPYEIYKDFLEKIRGVGPITAGILIAFFDIHKAEYPSSLWKYAGLDVTTSGEGRCLKRSHLRETVINNKLVKVPSYNTFLKSKILTLLPQGFLVAGPEKSPYAKAYYDYKNRLANHPDHKDKTKGHLNNMAKRYMVKRFLVDLYKAWRQIEGLPVAQEYSEAKLGITHKQAA